MDSAIELSRLPSGGAGTDAVHAVPGHKKRVSTAGSAASAQTYTSGNSLLTGASATSRTLRNRRKAAAARAERAQRRVLQKSLATVSRALRPLKMLKRPFVLAAEWYARRSQLPPSPHGRQVHIGARAAENGDVRTGKPYRGNLVTSSIYTVQDFVPRQLVAQFSKLANVYFLFVAILQMIPGWSATGNYTTIVPLCVFVMISMGREGYEDFVRHRNDAEENNREVLVAEKTNGRADADSSSNVISDNVVSGYRTTKWKDVRVGDIVRVMQNEWFPADVVLLHSSGAKGQCSIETLALDGESNLKSKDVPPSVQSAFSAGALPSSLVTAEDPNLDLFNFEGTIELGDGVLVPLNNNNIVYRGCTLRNTASVSGVVIYSGMETKMQLNASKGSRIKAPKLQSKVNRVVVALALLVIVLSGILTGVAQHMQSTHKYWYFDDLRVKTVQVIMGFIIMLNTLIPISLYVSMEICKVIQTFLMQSDIDMYDENSDVRCTVQSSSLNEELGQVSYVFSDKTGTLTDNVMLFRKLSVGGHAWTHDLDLYLGDNSEEYLFKQARPNTNMEIELLEQLARIPRKSFGGRIGGVGRPSLSRPSLSRPSLSRPSMAMSGRSLAMSRASTAAAVARKSVATARQSASAATSASGTAPNGNASDPEQEEPSAMPWKSSAGPTVSTPSTLTLLEYMLAHPNSAYTSRAKFFLLALALCHSATPVVDLTENGGGDVEIEQLDYQASSPDELALVSAARDLGYLVVDRQTDSLTIRTYPHGLDAEPVDEVYKVLDTIEFTSSRKRMSVIVQCPDGRIVLLCKGADNVMIERLQRKLLGTAHLKQEELREDAHARRSIEARLARDERAFNIDVRPSLDMILQRSSADQALQESARKSMQMQRRSVDLRQNIKQNARSSIQSAIADAKSVVEENAVETRMSLDRAVSIRRSGEMRSPHSPRRSSHSPVRRRFNRDGDGPSHISTPPQMPASPSVKPNAVPAAAQHHHNTNVVHISSPDAATREMDERQALERTLEHIDEFSTEGLRTLLYGHKFLKAEEYTQWKREYDEARAAISNRQARLDEVGERIEHELEVTGASAIEDKLQRGVPEAIDKLRRANIRMWMLTGDKRETAVNIGYSCRLIKDFSTVIVLKGEEDNLEEKMMVTLEELDGQQIAHCVVVIDGQTLGTVEKDAILLSLFVDLGLRADSVIVCRASPAQKANIVKMVRKREPDKVMLAIGDGANDIAMIQAADVGVGIAGREGLQAARSSDFSIGQFRFLLKLLLVHGRWNYNRTCKYILATFYKEFVFYMSQVIYQRYTLFTGTSVFESWSIAMFNTLFTSLPVISLGVMDQDLSPTTLIAVPELYNIGQKNRQFHFGVLLLWLVIGTLECVMIGFVTYHMYGKQTMVKDNTIFPFGVIVFTVVVVLVNVKTQFIVMMYYITIISVFVVAISVGGYWLFNIFIGLIYIIEPSKTYFAEREFWTQTGRELFYWAICLFASMTAIMFELLVKMVTFVFYPTDVDEFQRLEKDPFIMRRLEAEAELELSKGWEYQDKMPHSWSALLNGKLPGQERNTKEIRTKTIKRRAKDIIKETLRLRKPADDDREILEILERRQRETAATS